MSLFTVTESAKSQMVKICNKQDADVVRFSIKGGGCAGFEYNWEITDADSIEDLDEVVQLEEDKKFVIDNISIMYIAGAEFDFVEELMGSAF